MSVAVRQLSFLVAIAIAIAVVLASPIADSAVAATPKPAIAWGACVGVPEDPTVECATLAVPIDWDRPQGTMIDLALIRRPATDPGARIGSLVFSPGGPGASGVTALLRREPDFGPDISRRFDIVGFDPRGVGRSHPVVCSRGLLDAAPSPVLTSQADFDLRLAYNERLRADCRARTGALYDHMDTLSAVRDLDALRAGLGERHLTYWGESYGTLVGAEYAQRFPHHIRALALDGNIDHSLNTRGFLRTQAATVQDSFDEFAAWCLREAGCALSTRDPRGDFGELLGRADRGELVCACLPSLSLSAHHLIDYTRLLFYFPQWPLLAETLGALYAGTEPPEQARLILARLAGPPPPDGPELIPNPGMAIFCADWHLPVRDYAHYRQLLRESADVAPDMRYAPPALQFVLTCLGTPTPIANPQHTLRVHHAATPLLLVNARHDPATGYNWATAVAAQLGDQAVLFTYNGWGHIAFYSSPCVREATTRYLITQRTPVTGTQCPG